MLFDYDPEYCSAEENPKWIADKVKIRKLQAHNDKLEHQIIELKKKIEELKANSMENVNDPYFKI